jgi:pimeloyl-ACP methyl ester carboxylesterase
MTPGSDGAARVRVVQSNDGTPIHVCSLGSGPGLVIVGGTLRTGASYLALAERLAGDFEVHLMDRRGRSGSGPQRPGHSIEDECADLMAVAEATGTSAVFGHSFGGLVALETARRRSFELIVVYEPAIPLRGNLDRGWLNLYEERLRRGDRRGAFASMVKHAGFAPRALAVLPVWYVKAVLRVAIRPPDWAQLEPLLEASLVEHHVLLAIDAPSAERFATIRAPVVLLGGEKSPDWISRALLEELAQAIPNATVRILPGAGHLAPEERPDELAGIVLDHRQAAARAVG